MFIVDLWCYCTCSNGGFDFLKDWKKKVEADLIDFALRYFADQYEAAVRLRTCNTGGKMSAAT